MLVMLEGCIPPGKFAVAAEYVKEIRASVPVEMLGKKHPTCLVFFDQEAEVDDRLVFGEVGQLTDQITAGCRPPGSYQGTTND